METVWVCTWEDLIAKTKKVVSVRDTAENACAFLESYLTDFAVEWQHYRGPEQESFYAHLPHVIVYVTSFVIESEVQ